MVALTLYIRAGAAAAYWPCPPTLLAGTSLFLQGALFRIQHRSSSPSSVSWGRMSFTRFCMVTYSSDRMGLIAASDFPRPALTVALIILIIYSWPASITSFLLEWPPSLMTGLHLFLVYIHLGFHLFLLAFPWQSLMALIPANTICSLACSSRMIAISLSLSVPYIELSRWFQYKQFNQSHFRH